MNALTTVLRRAIHAITPGRRGVLRRSAPVWLGFLVAVSSAIPPATGERPLPILPEIPVALAGYPCSSHSGEYPMFTGRLSNSSGTQLSESTTGDVYGRVTNVDDRWQPSPGCGYYRYDGIIWAQSNSTSDLKVHWGALSGDAQPCNYVIGSTDYIHAHNGACPGETTGRMVATLTPEWTYQNDLTLDTKGDFAFTHSDCTTWYTKNVQIDPATTSVTNSKPGANCGYKQLDGTGTTQTLVVDGTAPTLAFTYPPAGGPIVNPAAWTSVVFSVTDAVAAFGGSDDWDLQRQKATMSGTSCLTDWATDGSVVSGITTGTHVRSQSLAINACYRWKLDARDENGNTATSLYSGSIRTDTSAVWGDQSQFRMESWDLGAGDTLAVSVGSGNVRLTHPIVSLPIRNGTLGLVASYNSHDTPDIGLGAGWRLNVQRRLAVDPGTGNVTFTDADGSRHTFTNPTGSPTVSYTRPATLYATLTRDTAANPDRFTLTYRDQSKDIFDLDLTDTGLLKQIKDRHGNTITVAYEASSARIDLITDPATREIDFTWTGTHLTSIVDWANVASGKVQTSGSGNRTHRFFYSGSHLIGWADPLNTSGSCPTGAAHLTCLTNANGLLATIVRTHTPAALSGGAITTGTWSAKPTTTITYASTTSADVTSVKVSLTDTANDDSLTTISHPNVSGQTHVLRDGTPDSETTYTLVSMSDDKGRIGTVERKLSGAQIKQVTTYNGTYPIEPASLVDNYVNGVAGDGNAAVEDRIVNYTYQGSSLGLLSRLDEPLGGTDRRFTDYTYNANNDLTRMRVYKSTDSSNDSDTRYCYTTGSCLTSSADTLVVNKTIENYADGAAGGANGHVDDVITTHEYDSYGQHTRSTRSNYDGSTLLDSAATGWTYDTFGNLTAEIRNYVNGAVACTGDDTTPSGTTNARTDLTTAYGYDTAGNRISTADPRRAIAMAASQSPCSDPAPGADDYISESEFDSLNQVVISRLPTTPGETPCSPSPACREATKAYDEFGLVREATDINDLITATRYDKAGRAVETYEDTTADPAVTTSTSAYDAQARILTSRDQRQVASPNTYGETRYTYDELGRAVTVAQGVDVNTGDGIVPADSKTLTAFDALDRRTCETTGAQGSDPCLASDAGQTTKWTHDIGGRVAKVDDEFTCATATFDYRDLALTRTEGLDTGSCGGTAQRVVANTYDGLGRLTLSVVESGEGAGDILTAPRYDAAGRQTWTQAFRGSTGTASIFEHNPLDQQIGEIRDENESYVSWSRSNFDAAGNVSDRCSWSTNPGTELCKAAGSTYTTAPAVNSTSVYDARNQRISLEIPGAGETTYDPLHNYQVDIVYVPTKLDGSGEVIAEHRSDHEYDEEHRLISVDHAVCPVDPEAGDPHACTSTEVDTGLDQYAYDANDNRNEVVENNGSASSTMHYCYDALDRLLTVRSATGCSTGLLETYAYDDAGNRTSAPSNAFTYDTTGQLTACTTGCVLMAYDDSGRTSRWNNWYLTYDGDGRLASACKVSGCATGDMVTMRYDGEGRRVELVSRPNGQSATTTSFHYHGTAIAQEYTGTGTPALYRTYVTDEAGAIVKFCDPDCTGSNPQYLVTWNGHGDALALWKVNSDGTLILANSFTYSTWGQPTTSTHNSIADLKFRFLYVGMYGVAWDNDLSLGLHYMAARHYSPVLGRFLQPDPSALEANLYAYGENNPISRRDPNGLICPVPIIGWLTCGWALVLWIGSGGLLALGTANLAFQVKNWCDRGCELPRLAPPTQQRWTAPPVYNRDDWWRRPNVSLANPELPSWVPRDTKLLPGESGKDVAKRLLDDKYGPGNWSKGANTEHNKIKKHFDRRR